MRRYLENCRSIRLAVFLVILEFLNDILLKAKKAEKQVQLDPLIDKNSFRDIMQAK